MNSKTSFFNFNKTLYYKTIKRLFPWSLCYTLILALQIPVYYMIRYHERALSLQAGATSAASMDIYMRGTFQVVTTTSMFFVFFAALLAAGLIYHFMFKPTAANTLHALPITKSGLFLTNFAAGMTLLGIPVIVTQGVSAIFFASVGLGEAACLQAQLLVVLLLLTLLFFSIASFASVLSGSALAMPVVYCVINFFFVVMYGLLASLVTLFYYGVSSNDALPFSSCCITLSPLVRLFASGLFSFDSTAYNSIAESVKWGYPVCYGIAGLLITLLAAGLYRLRKTEHTGNMLAFPKVVWFFQSVGAVGFGAFAVFLFYAYTESTQAACFIILEFLCGAVIGFFVITMLINKKFNIFRTVWKQALIFSAAAAAFLVVFYFDPFGIQADVPEQDTILSASVGTVTVTGAESIADIRSLHQSIVTASGVEEKTFKSLFSTDNPFEADTSGSYVYVSISYILENGRSLSRSYVVPVTEETASADTSILVQYYHFINEPENVLSELFCEDFSLEENGADLFDVTYFYSNYEDGDDAAALPEIPSDQYEAILEAVLQDIAEGNLVTSYYSGREVDASFALSKYAGSAETFYDSSLLFAFRGGTIYLQNQADAVDDVYILLNASMTNTIACLESLGLVNDTYPLTEEIYYDDVYYDAEGNAYVE